jgi:hypothetical protein
VAVRGRTAARRFFACSKVTCHEDRDSVIFGMATAGLAARWCGALALSCLGCSFISERAPPSTPGEHVARAEKRCDPNNLWYPIYDTLSVAAGVTWVIYANQHIDDINARNATAYGDPSQTANGDTSLYKWERAGGYSIIGLYGLSAVYGYITEAKCSDWREQRAGGDNARGEPATPRRPGFPGSVFGFGFNMSQLKAAQLCASKGQEWHLEGTTGLCQSPIESVAKPDLRLEFRMAVPSQITVIYRALPDALNKNYIELSASLRGTYGPPQVESTRVSAACKKSLSQCLENDEHPAGPVWHWAGGTIELTPVWQEDHALLELRYTREEPEAQ